MPATARGLAGSVALLLLAACMGPTDGEGRVTELESCHDGDTCTFTAWNESVRFSRIDAPEMDGDCPEAAREARDALLGLLRGATTLRVDSLETGFYGRIIGEVWADSVNASDWMLREGHAAQYEPGEGFCP